MGTIGSPETSVLNQPTLRNIPEDVRIRVNLNESLRFCKGPSVGRTNYSLINIFL